MNDTTMTNAIAFDTHRFITHLVDAGFTTAQAEALSEEQVKLLNSNLATKQDIEGIRYDIETLRQATKQDIEGIRHDIKTLRQATKHDIETLRRGTQHDIETLRQDTKHDIETLRQDTKQDIETLGVNFKKEMESMKVSQAKWTTSIVGVYTVIIGLFFHFS